MSTKRILIMALLLLPAAFSNASNLTREDYSGVWVSQWTAIKGENDKLIISPDLSSSFERKHGESDHITIKSKTAATYEDLLIIKYYTKDSSLFYKLVLSGWKSGKHKVLYGMLYIYEKGEEYNGLPVTFIGKQ